MRPFKIINEATIYLKKFNIENPKFDSELLLSYAIGVEKSNIYLENSISSEAYRKFATFIKRRAKKEPVAYIIGEKGFWSLDLKVNKNVLIPRPETEILIQKALPLIKSGDSVLEIGTGSGAIILSLAKERPQCQFFASDISVSALSCAKENSFKNGLQNKVVFFVSDLFSNVSNNQKFDIIVSNPPYIKNSDIENLQDEIKNYEPKIALEGGSDGLLIIRNIIINAHKYLKKNGRLILEIGYDQEQAVFEIAEKNRFSNIEFTKDYAGNTRIFCGFF